MRSTLDDSVLIEGSRARRDLLSRYRGDPDDHRSALRSDPSLAASSVDAGGFSDREVAELKRSVGAAKRLIGVERAVKRRVFRRFTGLAAALVALLALLAPAGEERGTGWVGAVQSPGSVFETAPITHPAVEAIGLPEARVYELTNEHFSVVLIVDDSFDL